MFKNNSFSIDSGNPQNNSFGYGQLKPNQNAGDKRSSLASNNEDDYDFAPNLANYNFKQVPSNKNITQNQSEKHLSAPVPPIMRRQQKQNPIKTDTHATFIPRLSQKTENIMNDDNKPRGLLKQKMKVDYAFDHSRIHSQIIQPFNKPPASNLRPNYSEVQKSDLLSANLFSCMDAPDYQRDFEITPKVISRK